MIRRSLVVLAVLALALPMFATHSWNGYHWARTSNPFTLKVHDNVNGTWETYLSGAQTDWNKSTVLDLNVLWQSPVSSTKRCTSTTGQIEVCNDRYGQTGWLGIAGISVSGSHITKGYTKLNDTYFDTAQYNTPAWRRLVTCQEVGHDFGLDHQDETFDNVNLGTCMDYTNDPSTNQHPNQHDYDMLVSIYNHADSSTTVGQTTSRGAVNGFAPGETGLSPKSWGRPVHFLRDGRPDQYVRLDGAGQMTVTHVFWVPGMGPKDSRVD